jgi:acetyl-CoA C-acetyltransferase
MTPNSTLRRVAIVGGNRIPFARSNTAYSRASNLDMLTATLQGLVDRFNLHGQRLGDVAAGAVMKHSRDFNLVREAVLSTTLSPETPAFDLQQACGNNCRFYWQLHDSFCHPELSLLRLLLHVDEAPSLVLQGS